MLACFVAALAVNELVHVVLETINLRQKLPSSLRKLPVFAWHSLLFVVITGFFFGLFIKLGLSIQTLLIAAIILMVVVYSYSTVIDNIYNKIGRSL